MQNTTLWTYVHSTNKDPHLYNGKPIEEYIEEAVKNGWMPLWPKKRDQKPRALIVWRANYLNQAKGNEDPEVAVEGSRSHRRHQLSHGHHGALLRRRPAGGQLLREDRYQHHGLPQLHPSLRQGLDPLFESKTDWDIFRALAKKMAQLAAERKLTPFHDEEFDWHRDFTQDLRHWDRQRQVPAADEDGVNFILDGSPETKGMTFSN